MSRLLFRHAVAVCFSAVLATTALAAEPIGTVVAVEGSPVATGGDGARKLSAGVSLFVGETISVNTGNAQLQLDDGTRLVVGPGSRLTLSVYLRKNSATASKVGIKALRGTFRFISGKSSKKAYDISAGNATIGIRGTGIDVTVESQTFVAVHDGQVRLKGRNGQSVILPSGCAVGVAGAGKTKARELGDEPKGEALQEKLPYSVDQSGLAAGFKLPISACLPFLADAGSTAPGLNPALLLPVVPAIVVVPLLLEDDNKEPISPSSPNSAGD